LSNGRWFSWDGFLLGSLDEDDTRNYPEISLMQRSREASEQDDGGPDEGEGADPRGKDLHEHFGYQADIEPQLR